MSLLLNQILRLTPRSVRQRAEKVGVLVVSAAVSENKIGPYLEAVYRCRTQSLPRLHKVVIRQYDSTIQKLVESGRLKGPRQTWLHCTCEFFCFVCEWVLARHKSSSIINSNGRPPYITNSSFIPMACKHITAVALINPRLSVQHENIIAPQGTKPLPVSDMELLKREREKILEREKERSAESQRQIRKLDDDLDELL